MYRWSCLLLVLLTTSVSVHAQTTANGVLHGRVVDAQGGVIPGAVVEVTNAAVPTQPATTTDGAGDYRFVDLPPGAYLVTVTMNGFSTATGKADIRAGATATLDFVMSVGTLGETIDVVHEAPLLDTQSGEHTVNVSGELLRNMPLTERREWFGALTLAPGVTTSIGNNEAIFYVHGADSGSNVVQIDGADMLPTNAGVVRFLGLSLDAISDIQIKTAGVDASAPLGVGGVINIATASGSNTIKGAATFFVQPRRWNDSNVRNGTSSAVDQRQIDLSFGAPIVHDRLWVFGAYRFVDVAAGLSRTQEQLAALTALVPGFTPFDNTTRAHLWFGKATAQLSRAHQLSGFYQYDDSPTTAAPDGARARGETRSLGGVGASARLNSVWSNRFTTRISASGNDKGVRGRDPGTREPFERVFQTVRPAGGRLVGGGRLVDRGAPATAWYEQQNSKVTLSLDGTLLLSGYGTHEVQAGVYAQPRLRVRLQDYYPNDGFIFENSVLRQPDSLTSGVVPFYRLYYDETALTRVDRAGRDLAFYVQDSWQPTRRLTLNAGVRIDRIVWADRLFDVEAQRSTNVGPRLSANYALTADAHNIVKAHWVRVHDQPFAAAAPVGTVSVGQRELYDLDLDGSFETTFSRPATMAITAGRSIDPKLHQPFVQEWGAGYSKQLPGATIASVDLVRRDFRDRPTLLETNRRYVGRVFAGFIDESVNEIYRATNNTWNWPVYTSLEMSVSKRTARLQALASYVRQWRHIAGTWQPDDPAGFIQPDAFDNARGIGSATGSLASPADADSLSGSSMTPVATGSDQWQDHVVRLGAAWVGPWQFLLATNYTMQSGSWSGPIVTLLPAPDPTFGPPTVVLGNGRVAQNPLATTIRFAYSNRGEGQLRTPALHVWNIRLGRRFALGKVAIDASLDVFNVTNNDTDATFTFGANQAFAPNFGTTQARQLPRSAQFVVRANF